jgi:hypothetical protein
MRNFILVFLALPIILMSCQQEGKKSVTELTAEAESNSAIRAAYDDEGNIDTVNVAQFEWEFTSYDFGTVDEGELVKFSYKFKNVGKIPLIVSKATGSCGCTVPSTPEEPIQPGETGEIKVQFDSEGRPGQASKQVTLTANTYPRITKLDLAGKVTPKATKDKN